MLRFTPRVVNGSSTIPSVRVNFTAGDELELRPHRW